MRRVCLMLMLLTLGNLWCLQGKAKSTLKSVDDGSKVNPEKVEGKYLFEQKNGYKAILLSAIIPGGGQFYNKSYLKGFAFAGLFVHHLEQAYENNKQLQKIDKESNESLYEHFYEKRQSYIGWVVGLTLFSMLDAFVDARLFNYYLMKKEIRLEFQPETQSVSLSYDF